MTANRLLLSAAVTVLLLCASCGSDAATSEPEPALRPNGTAVLRLVNEAGIGVSLEAEVADEARERETGLSKRDSLPPDAGMLFVLGRSGAGFWMKDTRIPLSVAFIAACGKIVHIAHMEPLSLQVHGTPLDHRFGLEVNQGWFERNGIAVGDTVKLPPELRPATCL